MRNHPNSRNERRNPSMSHGGSGSLQVGTTHARASLSQLADIAERIAAWEERRPLGHEGLEVVEP
jgi:hypothetical protein